MKHIAAFLLLTFCATVAFAGVSRRYKEWPGTPQGYFMTNAERTQWSGIQTDAEAEQFVNDFIAKRGGDTFVKEVAQSVAQADKYLSIGKTPGSMTVRGKMMILLGPTVATAATKKKKAGEVHLAPGTPMGEFSGPTVEDMQAASNGPGNSTFFITEYTYTYPAAALPAAYGKPVTVKIEVDPSLERDRFASFGAEKELAKLYEMAAQARLAAARQPTP
jgi:GWxTD domain-containing protein